MSYALSGPVPLTAGRRGGLLVIVLAVHAGLFASLLAAKTMAPPLLPELPLMVEFIEPPKIEVPVEAPAAALLPVAVPLPPAPPPPVEKPKPEAKPKPVVRPKPMPVEKPKPKPKPVAKPEPAAPMLETTASSEPAPASAPIMTASKPAPALAESITATNAASASDEAAGGAPVVGVRFDADYLENPAPPYPSQSRRIGEEGKVVLSVLVSAAGRAQEVTIRTSSGSSRLDDSALSTVRDWKFIPATRGGKPVDSRVLVPILFKLE